jgi:hypothetical protein
MIFLENCWHSPLKNSVSVGVTDLVLSGALKISKIVTKRGAVCFSVATVVVLCIVPVVEAAHHLTSP